MEDLLTTAQPAPRRAEYLLCAVVAARISPAAAAHNGGYL
jgi:hypothetical protein